MSLDVVIDAIAAKLKLALVELKVAELSGGQWDLEEMRRNSTKLPGAYVTCTKTARGYQQGGKFHCVGFFLVVLAVEGRATGLAAPPDRARAIVKLLSRALTKIAKAGDWGCGEVDSIPASISSANPYNSSIDGNNLALWGITWEQDLALVDDDVPAELPDLTSIHAEYSLVESSNEPDAEDDIDTDGP